MYWNEILGRFGRDVRRYAGSRRKIQTRLSALAGPVPISD